MAEARKQPVLGSTNLSNNCIRGKGSHHCSVGLVGQVMRTDWELISHSTLFLTLLRKNVELVVSLDVRAVLFTRTSQSFV